MAFAGVGLPEGAEAPADFLRRPCLVLWEAKERALASFMLPSKALSNPYALNAFVRTVDVEWGLAGERVVLRGDGEPALQALPKAVASAPPIMPPPPPTGRNFCSNCGAPIQGSFCSQCGARA